MGWEAEYQTLSYFLKVRPALDVFLSDHPDYPQLEQNDWDMIQEIVDVLRPITTAVEALQNQNYTPVSVVIPLLKVILGQLGEHKLPKTNFKQSVRLFLENTLVKYESIEELVLATLVDPRFKNAYFENEKRSLLVEKAAEILLSLDDRHSVGHNYTVVEADNSSNPFQTFLMEHKTAANPGPYTHMARAAAEVDDYLSREPSFSTDPFEYWKSDVICARYPCIKMLAMKYLSAPASTEYERLFPNVAVIHEEVRETYDSVDFEKLLFLHYNIPIFGFD
ncbi:dimerization domain protein, hAT family [Oesophagostomum dentatum]|uniref:Dimerization domain protein, hAT family n=1 Tax=Oesophagostomum dentatum TaxID=61180 RepID=A0A0B1SDL6_OESDE|nr:dimerization domain protein, hAT family [Oesophagostomum dentatum]